jgi:hypothetical protein
MNKFLKNSTNPTPERNIKIKELTFYQLLKKSTKTLQRLPSLKHLYNYNLLKRQSVNTSCYSN